MHDFPSLLLSSVRHAVIYCTSHFHVSWLLCTRCTVRSSWPHYNNWQQFLACHLSHLICPELQHWLLQVLIRCHEPGAQTLAKPYRSSASRTGAKFELNLDPVSLVFTTYIPVYWPGTFRRSVSLLCPHPSATVAKAAVAACSSTGASELLL